MPAPPIVREDAYVPENGQVFPDEREAAAAVGGSFDAEDRAHSESRGKLIVERPIPPGPCVPPYRSLLSPRDSDAPVNGPCVRPEGSIEPAVRRHRLAGI